MYHKNGTKWLVLLGTTGRVRLACKRYDALNLLPVISFKVLFVRSFVCLFSYTVGLFAGVTVVASSLSWPLRTTVHRSISSALSWTDEVLASPPLT